MLLIPYKTDAPVYHRPVVTIIVIVINVLVHVMVKEPPPEAVYKAEWVSGEHRQLELTPLDPGEYGGLLAEILKIPEEKFKIDPHDYDYLFVEQDDKLYAVKIDRSGGLANKYNWMLTHGKGLYPSEWLTANFAHIGWIHLIGNMIFLFTFSLVIEGKLGWWRYTLVFLLLGISQTAFEQIVMLPSLGTVSLGASGIVFGLIAMSLIWAPKNDVSVILWLIIAVTAFDISIRKLAIIYILIEILMFALADFSMSSAMLHLVGAVAGLVMAIVMLKKNWVDCEGWDYFSVRAGTNIKPLYGKEYLAVDNETDQEPVPDDDIVQPGGF